MKKYLLIIILLLFPVLVMAEEGTLVIENQIDLKDNQKLTYTINIEGMKGATAVEVNGINDFIIFDAQGEAEIEVPGNSTLEIGDIPVGSTFSLEVSELEHYNIYINGINDTSLTSDIDENTEIIITGKYFGREEEPVVKESDQDVKANPRTSDSIALIGLIALFTMLLLYYLLHKRVDKYTC
jgi:hypothetical protein